MLTCAEKWPPSSPDLNPLDYFIWSIVEHIVYRERITDVDHLKNQIVRAWIELSQETVNKCINQFYTMYLENVSRGRKKF